MQLILRAAAVCAALAGLAGTAAAGPHLNRQHLVRPRMLPTANAPAYTPTSAPAPTPARTSDPATVALVRRMLQAQNNLMVEGTMVTETPLGTFVQHAIFDGARAQRFECLSPTANRGEIIIDNGRSRYHSAATGKPTVQPSQMAMRRVRVPQVMQEIRQGNLIVQQVGAGTAAGRNCTIVRVGPPYSANWYQYWIDPTTGAQLRIEEYDSSNHRLSATYFTDVTYNPILDQRLFTAPGDAPQKPRVTPSPTVPSNAIAGFNVLQPAYLPPGFHFQSSVNRMQNSKNMVRLVYGNGLDALSLFETPDLKPEGPNAQQIRNPQPGVVTIRRNGLVIILVGSLGEKILESVLGSLH